MDMRIYTDGHKWYVQSLQSGNIFGRFNKKSTALDFVKSYAKV